MKVVYGLSIPVIIGVLVVLSMRSVEWQVTRYHDKNEMFSIDIPQDWRTDVFKPTKKFDTAYAFMASEPAAYAREGGEPRRPDGLAVKVQPIPPDWSLERYMQASVEFWRGEFAGFRTFEEGEAMLAGQPARWMQYTYEPEFTDEKVGVLAYVTVVDERAFTITFEMNADRVDTNREKFDKLAKSFRIDE